jgi:hypothetical protein
MISSKLYIQLERYLHIISPERKKNFGKKIKKNHMLRHTNNSDSKRYNGKKNKKKGREYPSCK